jgi:hypothetical protein
MKKKILLPFLILPLLSHPVKASEASSPVTTEVSEEQPLYATEPMPQTERSSGKTAKVAAIILALLATITFGLYASGAGTGKDAKKS